MVLARTSFSLVTLGDSRDEKRDLDVESEVGVI